MVDDTKVCPSCAETVKAAAVRCRFCGFDFAAGRMPQTAHRGSSKRDGGCGVPVFVGVPLLLLFVIFLANMGGNESQPLDPANEAAGIASLQSSALPVTATELQQAYEANEAAAQERYGNRVLAVTGEVESIDLDISDDPVIRLKTADRFSDAMVRLVEGDEHHATLLAKGQQITVICRKLGEIMGSPSLRDCALQAGEAPK